MISLFSLFSEVIESGGIGGAGAVGSLGVSAHVRFARLVLDGLWEGVGLIFAIAGRCRARLAIDVIFGPMAQSAMAMSSLSCAVFIAAS